MSVIYLYHSEDTDFGGTLSAACLIPVLDQFNYMFGGERVAIHPTLPEEDDYPHYAPITYPTLANAHEAYPDHSWVYLDPSAEMFIDEYEHPHDNVVYVVGHDSNGYEDTPFKGPKIKLRTIRESEGHAIPCLVATLCDRQSRSAEWQ